MEFDLDRPMPKVTRESERVVPPSESVAFAEEAAARLGLTLEYTQWNKDDFIWVVRLVTDYGHLIPPYARGMRVAGKGPSRDQATASCAMELMERVSLYRYTGRELEEHECADLRTGERFRMADRSDMRNTKCVAAGNNYEEAILHCLQELVETRLFQACPWKPTKLVDFDQLEMAFPDWVKERFVALKAPSLVEPFCQVTALRYPADGQFDPRTSDRFVKAGGHLFVSDHRRPANLHSPNSGGAGGLDPTACVFRAVAEAVQSNHENLDVGRRHPPPDFVQTTTPEDVANHETDSVTGDIRRILELLGEETFVGVIDVADPELKVPAVKLVSDWDPLLSLSSQETMALFFDLSDAHA